MRAKDIVLRPIGGRDAERIITSLHYSGKVVQNSQVHFGVFLDDRCGGCLSYGPPLDRRRAMLLVRDTPWSGLIELNRMALADWLPPHCESRAISVSIKLLKKQYPFLQWVQSYSDATQCGDGTIYRAAGFHLISIKRNTKMYLFRDGSVLHETSFDRVKGNTLTRAKIGSFVGPQDTAKQVVKKAGAVPLEGFQIRYVYFIDPTCRERLTMPILPYSELDRMGARMYKGQRRVSGDIGREGLQPLEGSASLTDTLHPTPCDEESDD